MKTLWHVFGLGGLFRVMACGKEEAIGEARKLGLMSCSWAREADKSSFERGEAQN